MQVVYYYVHFSCYLYHRWFLMVFCFSLFVTQKPLMVIVLPMESCWEARRVGELVAVAIILSGLYLKTCKVSEVDNV